MIFKFYNFIEKFLQVFKQTFWNSFVHGLARKLVVKQFQKLEFGELSVEENGEVINFGKNDSRFSVQATIKIINPQTYSNITVMGLNGAAEAYVKGWWSCDNLVSLVRLLVRNRNTAEKLEGGLAWLGALTFRFQHAFKRNRPQSSLSNIKAHYDLGNKFFGTFLDKTTATKQIKERSRILL